jgi:hypothetical protein
MAEAVERARALLRPPQYRLPAGLAAALEAAVEQAEAAGPEAARASLERARALAIEAGYL